MMRNNKNECSHEIKKIDNIFDVPNVNAFFFDMYGVLWDGVGLYDDVASVLIQLREEGKKVYILSNQTVTRECFIEKRAKQGLVWGLHYDDVITSGEVCLQALKKGLFERLTGKQDYCFCEIGLPNKALFESFKSHETDSVEQADVIYIGSLPGTSRFKLDENLLEPLEKALNRQLPAICANPDVYVMDGATKHFAQGKMARWYEEQGGRVIWFGKPAMETYQYALEYTNASIEKSIMVGDMLITDIRGANQIGMRSILVTQTGISAFDMKTQEIKLDTLIQQVAQSEHQQLLDLMPTYILPKVGFNCDGKK